MGTAGAIDLVRAVDQPGFSLRLDTGTVFITEEDPEMVAMAGRVAAHVHVSEPDLVLIGTSVGVDHAVVGLALGRSGYDAWRSVEMRASDDWSSAMATAARVIRQHYAAAKS